MILEKVTKPSISQVCRALCGDRINTF